MKSIITVAAFATLAGLLATGATAQVEPDPYIFVAWIDSDDGRKMFSPGIQENGDTLIHLDQSGLFFYIDDSTSQLVMTQDGLGVIGSAWIDTNDKGILKFNNDPHAHDYPLFQRNDYWQANHTISPQNADYSWFWCPLDCPEINGTIAVGTAAGDGCEPLDTVVIAYGD